MARATRVRVVNQQLVEVPAAKAWAWLTDWAGTNITQPANLTGDLALASIKLIGRHGEIPRTRVMEFGALGTIRETLRAQDDELMHIYYTIDRVGPFGIRNYLATTDIDEISPSACQITITARFDVPDGCDLLKAKALIDQAHNESVIESIRRYYAES